MDEEPSPERERGSPVQRTGLLLVVLIAGCLAMGYAIFWLIRTGKY
ncbi:MAG TPA: hypothetical protein VM686_16610 [Polyangiaceae bacterium]|nr:hypothetical protein [Polyangiaceae bacterium]